MAYRQQSTVLVFFLACCEQVSNASATRHNNHHHVVVGGGGQPWMKPTTMDLHSTTTPNDDKDIMPHSSSIIRLTQQRKVPRSITTEKQQRQGRLSIDVRGNSFGMSYNNNDKNDDTLSRAMMEPTSETSLSIDPAATVRLIRIALASSGAFISAFMGTLRLLAPL